MSPDEAPPEHGTHVQTGEDISPALTHTITLSIEPDAASAHSSVELITVDDHGMSQGFEPAGTLALTGLVP